MCPEKIRLKDSSDPWWFFLPGESFTDSRGKRAENTGNNPIPIRVNKTSGGLFIQAFGQNYFFDNVADFSSVVSNAKKSG